MAFNCPNSQLIIDTDCIKYRIQSYLSVLWIALQPMMVQYELFFKSLILMIMELEIFVMWKFLTFGSVDLSPPVNSK